MTILIHRRSQAAAAAVACVLVALASTAQEPRAKLPLAFDLGPAATAVLSTTNLYQILSPAPRGAWTPRPNDERLRGGADTYAATAPAVVVVRTSDGHGSGFFVDSSGLVITNYHVISSGLAHEPGGSSAIIHAGRLSPDGTMSLRAEALKALLYKTDPVTDLALLKVTVPGTTFPAVRLSATPPRPGQDCSIIGHPSSGMLWTFRPCQVASIGGFPADLVNMVLPRLASTGAGPAALDELLTSERPHQIMLTSAQANPGDSGGPVVDQSGALIGVTFAGPGNVNEDKFTYHVHLNEVKAFLATIPREPMLLVPDPWNLPPRAELKDLDGDGTPDVLAAGSGSTPEVLLFDLDGDSALPDTASAAAVTAAVRQRKWDFEVAVDTRGSGYVSYYDTDNNRAVDLILVTNNPKPSAQGRFVLGSAGAWRFEPRAGDEIVSPAFFTSATLRQRFAQLLQLTTRR